MTSSSIMLCADEALPATKRYSGRDFSTGELASIRALIANNPTCTRADLSRLTCRALQWYKADGGLCRVAMLRMQDDGLIQLLRRRGNARRPGSRSRSARRRSASLSSRPIS